MVGIDAKTQEELGPFGGSYRGIHARLIEKLNASGAKAIAFDVFFPENPTRRLGPQPWRGPPRPAGPRSQSGSTSTPRWRGA